MPLLDRNKQIPGSLRFVQPEIRWQSTPWSSFSVIVQQLMAARNAHPALKAKYGWSDNPNVVADEIDSFNTRICLTMGWKNYITAGGGGQPAPPPFLPPPNPTDQGALAAAASSVKAIWSGIRTLNSWKEAGYPAVSAEQSEARAAVCASCPKNGAGDWTSWFTKPAAEAIKRQAEDFKGRNLSTSHDAKLGVCDACLCPMKLKVHCPISFIKADMLEEVLAKLREAPACWIVKEMA